MSVVQVLSVKVYEIGNTSCNLIDLLINILYMCVLTLLTE